MFKNYRLKGSGVLYRSREDMAATIERERPMGQVFSSAVFVDVGRFKVGSKFP